ncbi:MAG: TraA family conjugative transfer protein [Panacagrimonas sp.]
MKLSNLWTFTKLAATRAELWVVSLLFLPVASYAATTGAEFEPAYQFIYDAATGYLGRGIAIIGGIIGLGLGAASGSALPAIIGVILAIFGALGPTIIDNVFGSAIV